MMRRQFYMTLPSNSSMDLFPSNTLSNFKVKLPEMVNLSGEWEVGLSSITFPHSWYSITKENQTFFLDRGNGVFLPAQINKGYYKNGKEVVEAISQTIRKNGIDGIILDYKEVSEKIDFKVKSKRRIAFENHLALLLGFEYKKVIIEKNMSTPFVCDLNAGFQSLFIYLDIIDAQIVGDTRVPLLCTVPAGGKDGEVITINYNNPQLMPLSRKEFETIEVLITDDKGEKVSFQRGRVLVTLNFRLSQSPYF